MDRGSSRPGSPVYSRQKSISSSSGSPMMSPMNRHIRSGSVGVANSRRSQNYAARAAAQRLARVMADKAAEDDSDDDDLDAPPVGLSTPRRAARSPSPAAPSALGRYPSDQNPVARPASTVRPSTVAKPAVLIPPIKPSSRPLVTSLSAEPAAISRREQRMSVDLGNLSTRVGGHPRSSSFLPDEIEPQHEENESILEKLRLAEEKSEEAEARVRQHEKQVTSFGDGVSLEARQLSRKESALKRKEVASFDECASLEPIRLTRKAAPSQRKESVIKVAAPKIDVKNEAITALRWEAKAVKDDAASVTDLMQETESEIKSLRLMAQKMLLTQEEMVEVVLKRCWLARYWKLCVQHGIHPDIAENKYEYWSSFAPLPLEVMLSAGEKARDGFISDKAGVEEKDKDAWDIGDLAAEGNIESMLLVEKGLRELALLKVEDAVMFAMSQHRRGNIKPGSLLSEEGQNPVEVFELSEEESEDVLFKRAWLTYFWRRAKYHGLEEDVADDRLQFWIEQNTHSPTSQDAVEVERGLFELKKLGVESQLWAASRRGKDQEGSNHGSQAESEL